MADDFHRHLERARRAQQRLQELEDAYAVRNNALARAWASRPDGLTWANLADLLGEGQAKEARLTPHALRHAVRDGNGGSTPRRSE